MKNSLLALLCILFWACNSQTKKQEQHLSAEEETGRQSDKDTLKFEKRHFYKALANCPKDSCLVYVKAEYPYFQEKNIRKFILNIITPTPYNDKIAASLEIAADSFINEYHHFHQEFPDSPAGYEWEQTVTPYQIIPGLISFEHSSYSYTGGAHGIYNTLYYNLQKPGLQKVELGDVLITNYHNELTKTAESIFRKDNNLSKDQDLSNDFFFENDKFYLNNNFLFTAEGIKFLYNPYEIAAYVRGQIEILIPYSQIKDLIKEDGILASFK